MKKIFTFLSAILISFFTLSQAFANSDQDANTYLEDAAITSEVKSSLLKNQLVDGEDYNTWKIHVKTINGVVILTGSVDNQEQKKRAEEIIKALKGVKGVENQLKIE